MCEKSSFNAVAEASQMKKLSSVIRKRCYFRRRSRLDRFSDELMGLKAEGLSVAELHRWLRKKRIKIAYSTVLRWVQKNG